MAFAIRLLGKPASFGNKGPKGLLGEIEIGSFKEEIVVSTGYWSKADYLRQWIRTVELLVGGSKNEKSALITEMYDPEAADHIVCWPMYRDDEVVYVHNRLLFLQDLPKPFTVEKLGDYIGNRETVDEAGNQISEWKTSITELREWLSQLRKL